MTAVKLRCKDELEEVRIRFRENGLAGPVLRDRTQSVDAGVLQAFTVTLGPLSEEGLTLLAVGGYGRRELFPFSDVDLLLLVKRQVQEAELKAPLAEFLRILWDSGLRASHSVHTVEECCQIHEGNFELTVSLLDARLLSGDPVLYGHFRERFAKFLRAEQRDMERRLCRMARARQGKYHDTIYRLEPDIKEAPGGMRDLQTARWLRRLRAAEQEQTDDPRPAEFLAGVRCFLHFRAGRDANLLNFEAQDEISAAPFSRTREPSEWMRIYYRHANVIYRRALLELEAAESHDKPLLSGFRDWRARLSNAEFTVSRDLVFLRNPHELASDPQAPLRLFRFVAKHGIPLARQTEQRLAAVTAQATSPGVAFWREFLSQPHSVAGLRAMAATGYLTAVLPEWEKIDHLVVRDFYHQYTVDEHTLVTLEVLEDIAATEAPEKQRFADLMDESQNGIWLLRFALLLHDIGKGSGHEHSQEAVRLAREVLRRDGFGAEESATVLFLIEQHLALSAVMQGRDLADPATARSVAAQVKTIERLRLLTLLTFADISAVNPTAMTPWRMEQLWRVYRVVARDLNRELTEPDGESPESVYGPIPLELSSFLAGLPWRYLWTHDRSQAEEHLALFESARTSGVALSVEKRLGVWRLSIVTQDRPFLFASMAGALSSFGLNILKAEAFSNKAGAVVDSFVFADPGGNLDLNPPELERLKQTLKRVALGEVHVEDLLRYRPVKSPPSKLGAIEPAVTPDTEASSVATIFEVITQDRPGLLYHLASAISRAGCNIEVVLVDTEAHKAIDVFHLTKGGAKLTPEETRQVQALLLAACHARVGA
jgi:[protein-PII] uridylyltransferase